MRVVGGEVLKCRSSLFQKKRKEEGEARSWAGAEAFPFLGHSVSIVQLERPAAFLTRWRPHNRRMQSDFWGCFSDRWPVSPNFWLVIGRRSADGRLSCFGFDTSHLICSKNFIETRETTTTHHALIFSSSFLSQQHSIIRS